MASLGTLVVALKADTAQFKKGMKSAGAEMQGFASTITALAAGAAGAGMLKLAADAETLQVKLKTLLGDGASAAAMFKEIGEFAAKTPFQKLEIGNAAQMLLAFNVEGKDVAKTLQMIGDISAMTGKPIGELAELYGKAQIAGRLMGDDVNQIMNAGIPILEELAKQFGVSTTEVRKLVSAGKVTAVNLTTAFESMTTGAGKFAGGMEALSQSAGGVFSTLKDNVFTLAEEIGAVFLPAAKEMMSSLTRIIQNTQNLPRGLARLGAALVAVAVAFKAVALAQMAFAKAAVIAQALSGPKGWATLAIGLTIAAGAMLAVDSAMEGVSAEAAEVAVQVDKANQAISETGAATKRAGRDLTQLSEDLQSFSEMVATGPEAFFEKMVEAAKVVRRISSSWDEYESRMARVVAQQSGYNDALRQAKDELALAQGATSAGQEEQRFRDMGVSEQELQTLRKIREQKEAIEEQQRRETEQKKEALKIAKAQKSLDRFRFNEELSAARASASQAKSRLKAPGGAGIATRGSSEALSTILKAGRKIPEQALAQHKKANKLLEDLLAEQRANAIAEFTAQGAV